MTGEEGRRVGMGGECREIAQLVPATVGHVGSVPAPRLRVPVMEQRADPVSFAPCASKATWPIPNAATGGCSAVARADAAHAVAHADSAVKVFQLRATIDEPGAVVMELDEHVEVEIERTDAP